MTLAARGVVRRSYGLAVLVSACSLVMPAMAQQATAEQIRARTIAAQGRAAFDQGDLTKGCPLLDEAYRIDGQLLGAGFALAECREKEGKLATAHRIFLEIAEKAQARGEGRADEARTRAAGLAPRLSKLKVDVSTAAADRADLAVEVDGRPLARSAWGTPEAVDGGSHTIVARAGGLDPWSTTVDVQNEGASVDVAVPFDRDAAPPPVVAVVPPPSDQAGAPFPWKTAGLVTGGVGVALLGAGVVVGVVAKGDYDSVEADCDERNACTPAAKTTRDDARGTAAIGTVLFVGGAVLAAAGVTVFLVAPDGDHETAALRLSPGALEVSGRF